MTAEPLHPELVRLKALVGHCEKRLGRAREKLNIANWEFSDANAAFAAAQLRLEDWLDENPEPQQEMF